jgi:hypothetical protein
MWGFLEREGAAIIADRNARWKKKGCQVFA